MRFTFAYEFGGRPGTCSFGVLLNNYSNQVIFMSAMGLKVVLEPQKEGGFTAHVPALGLQRAGYVQICQKGSHVRLERGDRRLTVPQALKKGTLMRII